jgi:hypothetical protein
MGGDLRGSVVSALSCNVKTVSHILSVRHFMLVVDLRKSAVLRDLAVRFLISLDNFSVLSLDLVVGTKFPWLGFW